MRDKPLLFLTDEPSRRRRALRWRRLRLGRRGRARRDPPMDKPELYGEMGDHIALLYGRHAEYSKIWDWFAIGYRGSV